MAPTPTAIRLASALASFLTLQGAAVLAMGVIMLVRADPTASPALVYALAPICLALALLTGCLLGSYVRAEAPAVTRVQISTPGAIHA